MADDSGNNKSNAAVDDLSKDLAKLNTSAALNPNAVSFTPRAPVAVAPAVQAQANGSQSANWRAGPRHHQHHQHGGAAGDNRSGAGGGGGYQKNNSLARPPSETEDYPAVAQLKEFIETITQFPDQFNGRIVELTHALNTCIVEDAEVVMETLVSTIIDQAIMDIYFRCHGVRLIVHLCDQLTVPTPRGTFDEMVLQRCQRETTRREQMLAVTDKGSYLRGLTHLIAELYDARRVDSLAQGLPDLLETLLSNPEKENVKTACQVLKLCGSNLEKYCAAHKMDKFETVMTLLDNVKDLPDSKLSKYMKEMAADTVKMRQGDWKPLPSRGQLVNPYLNYNPYDNNSAGRAAAAAGPPAPVPNFNPHYNSGGGGGMPPSNYYQGVPIQRGGPPQHQNFHPNGIPQQQQQQNNHFNPDEWMGPDDEDDDEIPPEFLQDDDAGIDSDPEVNNAFEEFLKQSGQTR